MDPFCPFCFLLHFCELPCTSVESYARLYVKTSISFVSCDTKTTYTTYQAPGIHTAVVRTAAAVVYS